MAFVRRLISLMGLLLFASACSTNGRYRDVPYDPPIDFSKLADDIGIAQQKTVMHGGCVYIRLDEWAASVGVDADRKLTHL